MMGHNSTSSGQPIGDSLSRRLYVTDRR